MKIVQIIAIGDEVLNGKILNTNAHWLARELTNFGYYIAKMEVIADDSAIILKTIRTAFNKYDLTIFTGGLGPTKDDLTKKVFQEYFHCEMKIDKPTLENIKRIFSDRNLPMLEINEYQAQVPEVCDVLSNRYGTAPGMAFVQEGKVAISLPGVPFEMKGIMKEYGFGYIEEKLGKSHYYSQTFTVTGITESFLAQRIADWEMRLRNDGLELAYLPSNFHINLRITTKEGNSSQIRLIDKYLQEFINDNSDIFVGMEGETISNVVGRMLLRRKMTIATMESCTAGGILNELVQTSGSSNYVVGGLVTYNNEMKVRMGKIPPAIIEKYTELSEECAIEMAKNTREIFHTNIGIGISGLMEKQDERGTFAFIALNIDDNNYSILKNLGDNRQDNIKNCIFTALNFLKNNLK